MNFAARNSDAYKPTSVPASLHVIKSYGEGIQSRLGESSMVEQAGGSKIERRVGSIFIHVSDMKRAVEWYSRVFDLPFTDEFSRLSTVYTLPLEGTEILLDSNSGAAPAPQPLMLFKTDDIRHTLQYLQASGVVIHKEILENNMVIFEDPDGNRLMAIQM